MPCRMKSAEQPPADTSGVTGPGPKAKLSSPRVPADPKTDSTEEVSLTYSLTLPSPGSWRSLVATCPAIPSASCDTSDSHEYTVMWRRASAALDSLESLAFMLASMDPHPNARRMAAPSECEWCDPALSSMS